MKEEYIAPMAFIIGFKPLQHIAADWDWSKNLDDAEPTESEIDGEIGNNPEGGF